MAIQIDIGIPEEHRIEIAKGLGHFLADTYTLYLKTHNFHWNVTGPMFQTLHIMFMEQYTELWNALDNIADAVDYVSNGIKSPRFASVSASATAPNT